MSEEDQYLQETPLERIRISDDEVTDARVITHKRYTLTDAQADIIEYERPDGSTFRQWDGAPELGPFGNKDDFNRAREEILVQNGIFR
jgi:hypothetical protein